MRSGVKQFMSVLFITLILGVISSASAADFDKAMDALLDGDLETGVSKLEVLAEQGHAKAQNTLGVLYGSGTGVPQDYAQAANWHRKAAKQGNAVSQFSLGNMYFEGQGVSQDYAQAANWFRKAAEQGISIAQSGPRYI